MEVPTGGGPCRRPPPEEPRRHSGTGDAAAVPGTEEVSREARNERQSPRRGRGVGAAAAEEAARLSLEVDLELRPDQPPDDQQSGRGQTIDRVELDNILKKKTSQKMYALTYNIKPRRAEEGIDSLVNFSFENSVKTALRSPFRTFPDNF